MTSCAISVYKFLTLSNVLMSRVGSLVKALDSGLETVDLVQGLLIDGIALLDSFLSTSATSKATIETLVNNANSICPEVADEVCTNLWDLTPGVATECSTDGIFDGEALQQFLLFFAKNETTTTSEFIEDIIDAREDLQDLVGTTETLQKAGDNFNWALYLSMAFSLVLAVLCMSFIAGAIFDFSPLVKCVQRYLFVPIFCLLVTLSWIFSMVFVIGSVGLADLCVDGPDDNILILLENFKLSPLVFRFSNFYVSGTVPICQFVHTLLL